MWLIVQKVFSLFSDGAAARPCSQNIPRTRLQRCRAQWDWGWTSRFCMFSDGDFWTFGTPSDQGERSDLSRVIADIRGGSSYEAIAMEHTGAFIKYHRGIREAIALINPPQSRNFKTQFVVYWGTPGTGKSKDANEHATTLGRPTYYKPRGEWWDGYRQQPAVIIDDFYGWIKYDELLKITDRYPHRVPIKGGFEEFTSSVIFITSNKQPHDWYHFNCFEPEALLRRIDEIKHYI